MIVTHSGCVTVKLAELMDEASGILHGMVEGWQNNRLDEGGPGAGLGSGSCATTKEDSTIPR